MLCAIYCRLSKEDEEKQTESESIQNQKSLLLKYALEREWDIFGIYCDEDYSGADRYRPAFNQLLRDAKAHRFEVVLCKSQSRFTRDLELVEKYLHGQFPLWGIRFVAIADHVDTAVEGNKKARQINGLINEWYLEDLSANIRLVFDHKRRQGQYIGSFPLYGYRKDPHDKNKLIIDQEAAVVVRQIFAWYLAGYGQQRIAQRLNEQHIPNPTKHKQALGWNYHNGGTAATSGLWNKTTVSRILHNEMYTGVMIQGRKRKISYKSSTTVAVPEANWFRVEGTHEPIIDQETFAQVQQLLLPRVKSDGHGEIHPLAGLVSCQDCGSTMTKTANGSGENRRTYLRCRHSLAGTGETLCSRHAIRLDQLITAVTDRLQAHIATYFRPPPPSRLSPPAPPRQQQLQKLQKELHGVEQEQQKRVAALQQLYLDKVAGVISTAQFEDFNHSFLAAKEQLEQRRKQLLIMVEQLNRTGEGQETDIKTQVKKFLDQRPLPRELFVLTIQKITVGEKDPQTGRQAIHIQWKF